MIEQQIGLLITKPCDAVLFAGCFDTYDESVVDTSILLSPSASFGGVRDFSLLGLVNRRW